MSFDVSTGDIESRWRDLSESEGDIAFTRLADADRKLRFARPALEAFYNNLADGTLRDDLGGAIAEAIANAVIRFLKNPDLVNRQDIGADGSVGIGYDTRTSGGVYIDEADLAAIDAAVAIAAGGTTRPVVGSQKLVSSFPWRRDVNDITILPTP
jgi:hypothetical protein